VQKPFHFLIRPLHYKLNAAIWQVPNVPQHVVLHSNILHNISKPHPLHAPAEMALSPVLRFTLAMMRVRMG